MHVSLGPFAATPLHLRLSEAGYSHLKRPCISLDRLVSTVLSTVTTSPSICSFTSLGYSRVRSPRGPLASRDLSVSLTVTPFGMEIGALPIRDSLQVMAGVGATWRWRVEQEGVKEWAPERKVLLERRGGGIGSRQQRQTGH
jgi:hypothetical protein